MVSIWVKPFIVKQQFLQFFKILKELDTPPNHD